MSPWQRIGDWCRQQSSNRVKLSPVKRFVSLFLIGVTLSVAVASCTGNSSSTGGGEAQVGSAQGGDVQLTLVSY
nr:sulfate ABC transporter substrate-binding protein [Oscillatoria sp. Prado101]